MKAILFNAVLLLAAIMEIQPVAAALINVKVDGFAAGNGIRNESSEALETSTEPTISETVSGAQENSVFGLLEYYSFASVDLIKAELVVKTLVSNRSAGNHAGAISQIKDNIFFDFPEGASDTFDLKVRYTINGTLTSESNEALFPRPVRSTALTAFGVTSKNSSGIPVDSLGGTVTYHSPDIIGATVDISDPDTIINIRGQTGDFTLFGPSIYEGVVTLNTDNANLSISILLQGVGTTDFTNTSTFEFLNLPNGVTFTSESGYFLTTCVATYKSNGLLHIPCVSVPDGLGSTIMFKADMKLIPLSTPFSFELTDAQQIDKITDNCVATFATDSSLNIPCVSVPDEFGGTVMFEAVMELVPLSSPLTFKLIEAQQKNK